ncbi:MAG: GtrA family protein [Sphingomonas sp.]
MLKADLGDPMSGFFMIRTGIVRALVPRLSGIGFKILLDIMTASPRPLAFRELPYVFRNREVGESKLDHVVALEYLIALYDRMFGRFVPVRFAMFSASGRWGRGCISSCCGCCPRAGGALRHRHDRRDRGGDDLQLLPQQCPHLSRAQRLKGWRRLLGGWVSFCVVCSVGAVANVGVAAFLFGVQHGDWRFAALAGIAVAAVWNFALSSRFTWGRY